ncbi:MULTISPECIES: STAS domain-containing protein [Pontibacillus]|uniref:STAS domain-containing protein n=1 Tax=Pontibacillus chungwhensis TaxID=265426 RepID=A0ABY8UVG0_9BACI|nr:MULTISPECIES: STAS domain-containing protein [Pontibacillus]MCD5325212.1 STAS domain-containing protein [Pontibacillus sp. HN14]WIF97459.1 STAS domain-containing protein [Pontibacillus chungwhensis]
MKKTLMRQVNNHFPVPSLTINKKYTILEYTQEASEMFHLTPSLWEIIEEASHKKVKDWIVPTLPKVKVEVNVITASKQVELVDLYVKWANDLQAEIMIIPKEGQNQHVSKMLDRLQNRLNETNFELLEEKEKLEDAIHQNNLLSAPFIQLTSEISLIPLFGDISEEKLFTIKDQVLLKAHTHETDCLLFDFTAVGEMHQDGVSVLKDIFTSLLYMGKKIVIVGIKPSQAQRLHHLQIRFNLSFVTSLQEALHRYGA